MSMQKLRDRSLIVAAKITASNNDFLLCEHYLEENPEVWFLRACKFNPFFEILTDEDAKNAMAYIERTGCDGFRTMEAYLANFMLQEIITWICGGVANG